MSTEPLTKRQAEVLEAIREFVDRNGYAPSYRELGQLLSLSSTATVAEHIEALRSKGYLTYTENHARSVQVQEEEAPAWATVPLFGIVAAGKPIEAVASSETIDIPRDMMGKNVFALKVKGDSMIDDGIRNGDYIIVERATQAHNGEVVVALVEREKVTLKRFYQEKDRARLQPANSTMAPLYVRDVEIQGKVRGLIRRYF